ncbi:hypothetical protein JT05_02870 [Desulfosporosinus sp. Tol-M]|jgi:hypothetical protein|nr:hypothetical protein JT05_02870 [Desulfosporosinus sp. Tol-M]
MDNKINEVFEEAHRISQSLAPVISVLRTVDNAKDAALTIEEIDLKFDELDGLYNQALRLCSSLFRETVSRVGGDAMEKVLQEEELTRVSKILRDIND